jgi:hypothetical protein
MLRPVVPNDLEGPQRDRPGGPAPLR